MERIEKNEMRVRFWIAKLEKVKNEELVLRRQVHEIELRNKLANMFKDDKDGYLNALKASNVYHDYSKNDHSSTKNNDYPIIVEHKHIQSKL
jgi:hypothetical protein